MNESINKMWSLHRVEFYPTIKENEVLIYSTTWMDSENMMFSEIS